MSEVTVVIGAGQIGQAIARRVSAGKHVLLANLHQPSADAAAEVLAAAGFDVSTATVDVSSRESVHALAEAAAARGDITGVIHCGSTASSPRQWPPDSTRCTWHRSSASASRPRSGTRSTPSICADRHIRQSPRVHRQPQLDTAGSGLLTREPVLGGQHR